VESWALPNAVCPDGFAMSLDYVLVSEVLTCQRPGLYWQAYYTIGVGLISIVLMIINQPPDLVLIVATTVLQVPGIITSADAWQGLSNPGVLSVAVLFIIARGLEEAGTLDVILRGILGESRSLFVSQLRLLLPVMVLSAFMNNTPVCSAIHLLFSLAFPYSSLV
jgi:hypothetical protein